MRKLNCLFFLVFSVTSVHTQTTEPGKAETVGYINQLLGKFNFDYQSQGAYIELPRLKRIRETFLFKYYKQYDSLSVAINLPILSNKNDPPACANDQRIVSVYYHFNPARAKSVTIDKRSFIDSGMVLGIVWLNFPKIVRRTDEYHVGKGLECTEYVSGVPFIFRKDIEGESKRIQKALRHLVKLYKKEERSGLFN